jgi:hypothetical protein
LVRVEKQVFFSIIQQSASKDFTEADVQVGYKESDLADAGDKRCAVILWDLWLYCLFPSQQ